LQLNKNNRKKTVKRKPTMQPMSPNRLSENQKKKDAAQPTTAAKREEWKKNTAAKWLWHRVNEPKINK
jgi:hypothetical protein